MGRTWLRRCELRDGLKHFVAVDFFGGINQVMEAGEHPAVCGDREEVGRAATEVSMGVPTCHRPDGAGGTTVGIMPHRPAGHHHWIGDLHTVGTRRRLACHPFIAV